MTALTIMVWITTCYLSFKAGYRVYERAFEKWFLEMMEQDR